MKTFKLCLSSFAMIGLFLLISIPTSLAASMSAAAGGLHGGEGRLLNVMKRELISEAEAAARMTKMNLLYDVLDALDRVQKFLMDDYSDINVDGVFGVRLAQGSYHGILQECGGAQLACPKDLVKKIKRSIEKLDLVADNAEPYLMTQDPDYMKRFHDALEDNYIMDYRREVLGEGKLVPQSDVRYNEIKGDYCFGLVLGSAALDQSRRLAPRCTITQECWDFFKNPDLGRYRITHELLYLMFIDKNGCLEAARKFDPTNDPDVLRKKEREMCRNILGEARQESRTGDVGALSQDLFLEQTVLCGMLGFEDFFAEEWIRMVLSWQYPIGCYSMAPQLIEDTIGIEQDKTAVSRLLQMLKKEAHDIMQVDPPVIGRKLLREQEMDGQCLSHKTGLAIGTLGSYLRYLVEQVYGVNLTPATRIPF